jgi:hypothetical protein
VRACEVVEIVSAASASSKILESERDRPDDRDQSTGEEGETACLVG